MKVKWKHWRVTWVQFISSKPAVKEQVCAPCFQGPFWITHSWGFNRRPDDSMTLQWSTLASLWLKSLFKSLHGRTMRKMTSDGSIFVTHAFLLHITPTANCLTARPRREVLHLTQARYNQNNISNRKRVLLHGGAFLFFFCNFEQTTLLRLTCRRRPQLEDLGGGATKTKKQKTDYKPPDPVEAWADWTAG